jgi:hypothetical protein
MDSIIEDLYTKIYNIEDRIGVIGSASSATLSGEIALMRRELAVKPFVEIDLPIDGDTFITTHRPVSVGGSAIVNGHAIISLSSSGVHPSKVMIEEWRGITFQGNRGTIAGSEGAYDGHKITLTYFYSTEKQYGLEISNGFLSTREVLEDEDDIIIKELLTSEKYKISSMWDGSLIISQVAENSTLNDTMRDSVNGEEYRLYMVDGFFDYEKVKNV